MHAHTGGTVPSPRSRAIALVAALDAATGSAPTLTELPDRFRVEVELPHHMTRSRVDLIVAALDTVTAYGHRSATDTAPATLWAEIAVPQEGHGRRRHRDTAGTLRRLPPAHRTESAGS